MGSNRAESHRTLGMGPECTSNASTRPDMLRPVCCMVHRSWRGTRRTKTSLAPMPQGAGRALDGVGARREIVQVCIAKIALRRVACVEDFLGHETTP